MYSSMVVSDTFTVLFEFLTVKSIKTVTLWTVMPCNPVGGY